MSDKHSLDWAFDRFDSIGVDPEKALDKLSHIPLSIQCWQGDDVCGFENSGEDLGGGLAITGNYPGKAGKIEELWSDLEFTFSLLPGTHRLNLHASYGDFKGKKVDRDQITTDHFDVWVDWAKSLNLGLDFNPTYFAHPKASDGWTLAHPDESIREFWINHGIACREIGAFFGKNIGYPCVTNFWIPDGFKDKPVDRFGPRERLTNSLDKIFKKPFDGDFNLDSVESKLFGIGSESYVAGSYDYYLSYAISRKKHLCLDSGHFHPTESIADKISSVLPFLPGILLHISRGVRWDSDHVVSLDENTLSIAREIVRADQFHRIHIGLDFFDASINRIAAWVIGSRNVLKALMIALLEPYEKLSQLEKDQDYTKRLALIEELKMMPFGILWDYYCECSNTPTDLDWLNKIEEYENSVLAKRN